MIILDMTDKRPIYEQIVYRFKELICREVLKANEQMPSVRSLAVELSINPNTIQRAYIELEREGFIYSVKGKGNYVADIGNMLPERQKKFYEELDDLMDRLDSYSLTKDEVINHIKEYKGKGETL